MQLFPMGVILWWALANPSCVPNLKSLASAVADILKGKPQISGSSPNPGLHPLLLLVGFDDGPWQTPAALQIWSRWLHLLRKYKGICFKRQIRFLSHPWGSYGKVRTSSIARWKACSRFRIYDNWTFLLALTADALIRRKRLCWRECVTLWLNIRFKGYIYHQHIYTVRWEMVLLQLCHWKFSHKETL